MDNSSIASNNQSFLDAWQERIVQAIVRRQYIPANATIGRMLAVRDAFVSVLVVTVLIFPFHMLIVRTYPHAFVNISFLYLLAIIWLASTSTMRASIIASLLAFLAYDFFYTEPVYRFTISDPSEWISLIIFLIMSFVVGLSTSALRVREQFTRQSQERTARLYELSQEIAMNRQITTLIPTMTKRICRTFATEGVQTCAAWITDDEGIFGLRSIEHSLDQVGLQLHLDSSQYQAQAEVAHHNNIVTKVIDGITITYFVPLRSSRGIEGVLSISGTPSLANLVQYSDKQPIQPSLAAEQFTAFCDQIALAIERVQLQKEAIQVVILRESEQLKDALLNTITHDLRTPITAIQTAASSLQQTDIVLNTSDKAMLTEKIMVSSRRLATMVDNLLSLSHTEMGAASAPHVQYPINDVISTALDVLETAGQLQNNPVTVEISEDPLEALMDHLAIERVVINLVENATKYAPPGSPIVISAHQVAEKNKIIVQVHDHGIGIPNDKLASIFVKFNRLQQSLPWLSPNNMPKGTGLGLAACAGIIHEHGGEIWAESIPNEGSTFTFTLPIQAIPKGTNNG